MKFNQKITHQSNNNQDTPNSSEDSKISHSLSQDRSQVSSGMLNNQCATLNSSTNQNQERSNSSSNEDLSFNSQLSNFLMDNGSGPQMTLETGSLSYQIRLVMNNTSLSQELEGQQTSANYSLINKSSSNSNSSGIIDQSNSGASFMKSRKSSDKNQESNLDKTKKSDDRKENSSSSASNSQDRRIRDRRRLFVGGITGRTKMDKIQAIFSRFGKIIEIKRPRNDKGAFRGFCFIEYESEESVTVALEYGNLWHNDRLLSLRRLKSSPQLASIPQERNEHRITIYGFPKILDKTLKSNLQEFFSSLGQLEYFYYMYVRIDKIENDDIQEYIKVNNLQTTKYQKIHILNISYKDATISQKLLNNTRLNIGGRTFMVSYYTRKMTQEEVDAKNQKETENIFIEKPQLKSSLVLHGHETLQRASPQLQARQSQFEQGVNSQIYQQMFYSPQHQSQSIRGHHLSFQNVSQIRYDKLIKINSMDCIGPRGQPQHVRQQLASQQQLQDTRAQYGYTNQALVSYLAQREILQRNKIRLEVVVPYNNFDHKASNLRFNHPLYYLKKNQTQ